MLDRKRVLLLTLELCFIFKKLDAFHTNIEDEAQAYILSNLIEHDPILIVVDISDSDSKSDSDLYIDDNKDDSASIDDIDHSDNVMRANKEVAKLNALRELIEFGVMGDDIDPNTIDSIDYNVLRKTCPSIVDCYNRCPEEFEERCKFTCQIFFEVNNESEPTIYKTEKEPEIHFRGSLN